MSQRNEHLTATAEHSARHVADTPTVSSLQPHQPVQPVSGIVFDREFFNEVDNNCNPDGEMSLHTPDEYHTEKTGSISESNSAADSLSPKSTSAGPRYSFSTDIPENYDDFYLCVLPRDPKTLYVYWELPDGTRSPEHTFQEQAPSKEQLVLRIKGQTIENNEAHISSCYDVPIQMNVADSYVHVPAGASQCSVECGIVNEHGCFRPYSPPENSYDQSGETIHFHTGEEIVNRQPPDNFGTESAPVSVGTAFIRSVTDSYCTSDINDGTNPLVKSVDLPVVKLDTAHYFGSATPV